MSLAKEAWVFVLPPLILAAASWFLGWSRTSIALAVLGFLLAAFFRIPRRDYAGSPEFIIAPANGVVTSVEDVSSDDSDLKPLDESRTYRRVVTFLNVFNVHVQRAPTSGRVSSTAFRSGRKVAAFRKDAGVVNESQLIAIERDNGDRIGIKQIAGLLARRVVSYVDREQSLERGELIGLIKFGSRVDLLIPEDYTVLVGEGDRMIEGLTEVARAPAGGL